MVSMVSMRSVCSRAAVAFSVFALLVLYLTTVWVGSVEGGVDRAVWRGVRRAGQIACVNIALFYTRTAAVRIVIFIMDTIDTTSTTHTTIADHTTTYTTYHTAGHALRCEHYCGESEVSDFEDSRV